jgi:lipoprotein-releasing system permease protein
MTIAFFIAKRYLAAGTKKHLIYRMGLIACLSVAISTTALLIVLSVFNGLEGVIRQLFYSFDPDLKIKSKESTYFIPPPALLERITALPGVEKVVSVIEENALFVYNNRQMVAKLKGVSTNFLEKSPLATHILQGNLQLVQEGHPCALVGLGIQHTLSIRINNIFRPLQVFCPRYHAADKPIMQKNYTTAGIRPGAIFSIEKQFDDKYVLVPLDFAIKLLACGGKRTALEVRVTNAASLSSVQREIEKLIPLHWIVLNRDQQHVTLFRTLRVERLLIVVTFSLIVLVASLNIFFILSMLVLAKKTDVTILHTIGMPSYTIRNIFIIEGLLISLVGMGLGMFMAWGLTWLQEHFGLVSLGLQTSLIKAYPVKRHTLDFMGVGMGIFLITLVASYRPAVLTRYFILPHKLQA